VSVDINFLRSLPVFRGLAEAEMMAIGRCCEVLDLPADQAVFEMGAPADGAYLVQEGLLEVELPLPNGTKRTVARLGPGTVVGELCLLEDAPRSLRVRAAKPSRVVRLGYEPFQELRARGHQGVYKVIRNITLTVCDRLRKTNNQIENRWKGVSESSTEVVVATPQPEKPQTAWDKLRGLFGRP
jgi:CRP/FNR family cyclic AMP-dependent transcriptional regulator